MRGKPLMPCSPAKARHMLKAGKAFVVRRTPFTIKLTIATGETKQDVTLGVDAGARHVGISATTEKEEVFASEVALRQDITGLLADRLAFRRARRNRKTRYRGECQDFCVWGGYSRGSPTRLPFVFEMQYARPDAIAGAKVEGPPRSAGGSSLAPAIARREAAGALAREV